MMTDVKINANERIDDLCRDNLKLIQNTEVFCFGMDAVLLSTFASARKIRVECIQDLKFRI